MAQNFLTPRYIEIANEILEWAKTFLMVENPNVKRPHGKQIVCPFVEPSIRENRFFMTFHPEINGLIHSEINSLVLDYADVFIRSAPYGDREIETKALLMIFPEIPEKSYRVLDFCHDVIKDDMVKEGLMVGQFHPHCRERGVHNPNWRNVSKSPHPLIAMRHMRRHDIVFIHEKKEWFLEFDVRFSDYFKNPEEIPEPEKYLERYYALAKDKWA